jgi:hypothetical protein
MDADNLSGTGENFFFRCAAGKHVDRLLRARAEHLAQVFDHDLVRIHRTLSWLADVRPRCWYIASQEKHDVPARRTWRKLHLAIDEHHQVLACELTTPAVDDSSAVADLLTQIVTPFETFIR